MTKMSLHDRIIRRRARRIEQLPPPVVHALSYFVWSALDDWNILPTESRPFGDDERFYNNVINAYLFPAQVRRGELTSTAQFTYSRPDAPGSESPGAYYGPNYFPDEMGPFGEAKDHYVTVMVEHRIKRLKMEFDKGMPVNARYAASRKYLVCADGYLGYYEMLRARGCLFADASPSERENACIESMRAAVVPFSAPVDDENEWRMCRTDFVERGLPDFVDPFAVLV
jgi:hypothetical protein